MRRILNLSTFFVVTMAAGLAFAFGVLCFQQAVAFVDPPRFLPAITPTDETGNFYEMVAFITSDEVMIEGWYTPPTRADGATFLYLHGHASNRNEFIRIHELSGEGYGALMIDLRGHGSSEDAPVTMGVHEVRDVQAALDWLDEQPEVNPERIALYGHSMGAATAIRATAQRPDVRVVIASAPYTSIHDALVAGIPQRTGLPALFFPDVILDFATLLSGADYRQAAPIDALDSLTQPLFVMHGTDDVIVPYAQGLAVYEAAVVPKMLYTVDGAGHNDAIYKDVAKYQAELIPFLEAYFINP